ncbi:MAG: hypothetical protein KDK97_18820, partial [Verrucomicrobiales bacterium]|nr:hypothetical protein [Verrucomicrobiales bacterium]
MVSERRSDIERLAAKALEMEAGGRRTLLVKIPEFSRSLVIRDPGVRDNGELGAVEGGRSRPCRHGVVMGVTVEMVAGNSRG